MNSKTMPVEYRIYNGEPRTKMIALGEYSQKHRIKDDQSVAASYFATWSELRQEKLSDGQIEKLFRQGKDGYKKIHKEIKWHD